MLISEFRARVWSDLPLFQTRSETSLFALRLFPTARLS